MAALNPLWDTSAAPHRRHVIQVEEDVGALRRDVTGLAVRQGVIDAGPVALVATELATNLLRHASPGGYILYRHMPGGIELISVDAGPGMRARGSGPAEGLGMGLAGVQNVASSFDVFTASPGGTVVLARVLDQVPPPSWYACGGVNVGLDRSGESGDRWAVDGNGSLAVLVVDGLGHGPDAARAARTAAAVFDRGAALDPGRYVRRAHEAMRGTRGAVLAVVSIDPLRDEMVFTGLGNITGRVLYPGSSKGLLSRAGTLGTEIPLRRLDYVRQPWEPGSILVLSTDGLRNHWNLGEYPGLSRRDPAVIAAVLHRDHGRSTDDATALVVRDTRRTGVADAG